MTLYVFPVGSRPTLLTQTQRCYSCTEVQVSRQPVSDKTYEDPNNAFFKTESSSGSYPDYFSSANTSRDTNSSTVSGIKYHFTSFTKLHRAIGETLSQPMEVVVGTRAAVSNCPKTSSVVCPSAVKCLLHSSTPSSPIHPATTPNQDRGAGL